MIVVNRRPSAQIIFLCWMNSGTLRSLCWDHTVLSLTKGCNAKFKNIAISYAHFHLSIVYVEQPCWGNIDGLTYFFDYLLLFFSVYKSPCMCISGCIISMIFPDCFCK